MPKPFDTVLRDIRYGECLDELTEQMAELVAAVSNTNKAGSLTITFKLKPAGGGSIELTDDIKSKVPTLPKGSSIFFATPDNNLVRNDPRQPELSGLKSVAEKPAEPIREVAA